MFVSAQRKLALVIAFVVWGVLTGPGLVHATTNTEVSDPMMVAVYSAPLIAPLNISSPISDSSDVFTFASPPIVTRTPIADSALASATIGKVTVLAATRTSSGDTLLDPAPPSRFDLAVRSASVVCGLALCLPVIRVGARGIRRGRSAHRQWGVASRRSSPASVV